MTGIVTKSIDVLTQYKKYFKSSFLYLFSSLFTAAIGIAINPFLASNLSPEDYAVMGYFNSFSLIVLPILNFSLISYYLRNYFRIPEERRQIVSDTILIALVVYGFVALVAVFLVFYVFCQWRKISFPFYPYALLTFAPIYFSNFVALYLANCRLKHEAGRYGALTIANSLFGAVLAILLVVVYKYGASGRLVATLLASVIPAVYCFSQLIGKLQFDFEVIKDAFRFGWPLSLSAMLWYFLSGIDSAMLERLNDSHTFGFYSVGLQIAGYFGFFYTAIAQTFEPDIYKAIADNKKGRLIKILVGIFTLNAIPNIIFIIFAPVIIGLMTNDRYIGSSEFAQILAIKNIVISIYYSLITVVVGYGFTKSQLAIIIIGSILSVVEYKILIERYAFTGAAWGQVFSMLILSTLVFVFLVYKKRGIAHGYS
jgi:O-antigen/teichoic acid export membrane protein